MEEGNFKQRILELLNNYNSAKFKELPDLESELKRLEYARRKKLFSRRFDKLKKRVDRTNNKLKKQNRTQKDIMQSINNTLDFYSFFDKGNPTAALGIAEREYQLLGLYISQMKETIANYRAELRKQCGADAEEGDKLLNDLV